MKNLLLTGGAGGLGHAVAVYFADRGYRVFSCDIMEQESCSNIVPVHIDLRDMDSVEAARAGVASAAEKIDVIIHLAGLYMMDSFVEISEERLSRILDVNLMGVYRVNRAFLPLLMKDGGRIIITTSELAGLKPLPFAGIYALTKTALQCYADSLRLELALLGIPVIEIRPGAFRTRLTDEPARELKRLQASTKLYGDGLRRIRPLMNSRIGKALAPETLAKVIYRAATAKRPPLRFSANASFLLRVYSALPRGIQMFAMKRLLG